MNAIILCAGTGQRFQPLSHLLPKCLMPINDVPLLEQQVHLLRRHGVQRITLVTGHLARCLDPVAQRLDLECVHNPRYATANNNVSLQLVRDRLENTLILDGDLFFCQDFFPWLQKDKSQFISQQIDRGKEWELCLDASQQVREVQKWSSTGWGMVGVSWWTGEAARQLAEELPLCAPDEYWEDAALRVLQRTPVYASCVPHSFVQEMDSLNDALQMNLITHEEIASLCSVNFAPHRLKGLTNNTWLIRTPEGSLRTLRIPGKGTERYIRREEEPQVIALLKDQHLTPTTTFYHDGLKSTDFLQNHRVSNAFDYGPAYFQQLAGMLRSMHSVVHSPHTPLKPIFITDEIAQYEEQSGHKATEQQRAWLLQKGKSFDAEPTVLSHRDLLLENILVSGPQGAGMQLIDFEYAGFAHPLWDAASFILEAQLPDPVRAQFMEACQIQHQAAELHHMEILVDYIWGLWGLVNNYQEYGHTRLHRAMKRLEHFNFEMR